MSYTNPNEDATYTFTTGELTNSTVADTTSVGADTYAKTLYLSGTDVTADDLTVASGGILHLREGEVGTLIVSGGDAELHASHGSIETLTINHGTIYIAGDVEIDTVDFGKSAGQPHTVYFSGGVINGGIVQGNPVFSFSAGQGTGKSGGTINNVTFTSGTYLFLSAGLMYNCTIENKCGPWRVAGANTVVSSTTILQKEATSQQRGQSAGLLKDCLITDGGFMRQQGGSNVNLTISNGSMRLSGGTLTNASADYQAKVYISGGTVNGITAISGGIVYVQNGASVSGVKILGLGAFLSQGTDGKDSTYNRAQLVLSGGVISGLVMSGGVATAIHNENSKTIYNIDITNENNGKTAPDKHVEYGVLNISSNTYVSGGSLHDRAQINVRYATVENVNYGKDTWDNFYQYAIVSGGTATDNASLRMAVDGHNLISETVFTQNAELYVRGEDSLAEKIVVRDNATVWMSNGIISSAAVSGGVVNMISGGAVAKEVTVFSGGSINAAKGTLTDIIEHGGYVEVGADATATFAEHTFSELTIGNFTATVHENTTADRIAVENNGVLLALAGGRITSGSATGNGQIIVSGANATANNVSAMESGAWVHVAEGAAFDVFASNGGARFSGAAVSADRVGIFGNGLSGAALIAASMYIYDSAKVTNVSAGSNGTIVVSGGGVLSNATFLGKNWINANNGGLISGGTLQGSIRITNGGTIRGVTLESNTKARGDNFMKAGATLADATIGTEGYIFMSGGLADECIVLSGGLINVSGGELRGVSVSSGGVVSVLAGTLNGGEFNTSGALAVVGGTAKNAIFRDHSSKAIISGGNFIDNTGRGFAMIDTTKGLTEGLVLVGSGTSGELVASCWVRNGGTLSSSYLEKTMAAFSKGATVRDVTFGANTWINMSSGSVVSGGVAIKGASLRLRDGGTIESTVMKDVSFMYVYGGEAADITVEDEAIIYVSNAGVVSGTILNGGRLCVSGGAIVTDTTVSKGGNLYVQSSGANMKIAGATVLSGGSISFYTSGTTVTGLVAEAGAEVKINVLGTTADTPAAIDSLANVAEITVANAVLGTTYTLAETGNTALKVLVSYQGFNTYAKAGESYINPLYGGRMFTVNAEGTTFKHEEHNMSGAILTTEAANLAQSGAAINNGDKALMWADVQLASGSAVTFATNAAGINGDAWLDLDRTKMHTSATLYGAEGNFGGTIRYLVHGAGSLGNFAAGAQAGGTVGGVELVSFNNNYGQTYLGGFGNVTGRVSAFVSSGNTLSKDFYAGALANYAKTGSRTSVGSIDTTILMRTDSTRTSDRVKGNIYGASQVKAGTIATTVADAPIHTVGNVNLTLAGGTADKSDICVFTAGYANGTDSAMLAPVYTVDSVNATVSGGSWGGAHGGRGVFGGAFAAGVVAEVENVNLTISGGTMGNVYGGGWAQRGGKSVVGDVSINITGGTVTNVFGGGTHSTAAPASTTETGKVSITVSGGTVTGDIFARGQAEGDTVGTANVTFTGSKAFACNVWGYSYVGGDDSDATLTFDTYTGKFSGKFGGFADVEFAGDTRMTLQTAAADVSNGSWVFDLADRGIFFDDQAILNWTGADFTEDTITLKLISSRSECWTLVSGADASKYNTAANAFAVEIDGAEAISLTFDAMTGKTGTIADGAYQGWGFAVEDSVLKFTKLA